MSSGSSGDAAALSGLSPTQRRLVRGWLPGAQLWADLSWGLIDSTVLHLRTGETVPRDVIVKASGAGNHHLDREITAHKRWVKPLRERGVSPVLRHADAQARILITEYLPGDLVQGHAVETDPGTYRQAGDLLAALHRQEKHVDEGFNTARRDRALWWLGAEHRITPAKQRRLREILADHPTEPVAVVPTHGDYHPRNWLTHEGRLAVIDFGRAGLRPAQTDLARLAVQQFRADRELERAFTEGYGADPRGPDWPYVLLTEAIGTAVWAYQVGDEGFESQGHRMLDDALALF